MTRLKRACGLLFAMALLFALCGAYASEEKNPIGFYVRPVLPSNQLAGESSYFSLMTRPEGQQTLQVEVYNQNSEDIEVTIEVNNAYTNRNGVVEYAIPEEGGAASEGSLAAMIAVEEPVLLVPANGSATARLRLTMPKEPIEGELLAGILIAKVPDEEEEATTGAIRILNVFKYAIAVRVTQSVESVAEPDFALQGARMDTIAGFPAVVLDVVNQAPWIFTGVVLTADVYAQDAAEPVLSYEMAVSMTPGVSAPLSKMLMDGPKLKPGTYRVQVTLGYEEQEWRFEAPLSVE